MKRKKSLVGGRGGWLWKYSVDSAVIMTIQIAPLYQHGRKSSIPNIGKAVFLKIQKVRYNMKQNSIFRDELPGEKKSIVNLLMTGYIVVISCLGYSAFFLYIQLTQVERIVGTMNTQTLAPDQMELLKDRIVRSAIQLKNEMIGMAIVGALVCLIGGLYTISMIIKPLKKLVRYAEEGGTTELPEFKSNTELKQLATAITALTENTNQAKPLEKGQS